MAKLPHFPFLNQGQDFVIFSCVFFDPQTSSLVAWSLYVMFSNLRKNSSKGLASFSLALSSRSMTHRRTKYGYARERISFTFNLRYMLLSLHIGFSFVRAAVGCAILEKTVGFEPLSETIATSYLKLVTVRSFCPLTLISLWKPLAQFVISLVFLALISILYLVHAWARLSTRAFRSSSSSASASMSSVNRRLGTFFPLMLTFPSCFLEHQT